MSHIRSPIVASSESLGCKTSAVSCSLVDDWRRSSETIQIQPAKHELTGLIPTQLAFVCIYLDIFQPLSQHLLRAGTMLPRSSSGFWKILESFGIVEYCRYFWLTTSLRNKLCCNFPAQQLQVHSVPNEEVRTPRSRSGRILERSGDCTLIFAYVCHGCWHFRINSWVIVG